MRTGPPSTKTNRGVNMFRPEIIKYSLTPEQRAKGFSLEVDGYCLYLLYKGERVAPFSATGATIEMIR